LRLPTVVQREDVGMDQLGGDLDLTEASDGEDPRKRIRYALPLRPGLLQFHLGWDSGVARAWE
jgi:hypothetical protein